MSGAGRQQRAGAASRNAALRLLRDVLEKSRPLDEAWAAALAPGRPLDSLSSRDRAFARQLVATTLRRLGQIDDALRRCMDRPLARGARPAQLPLRLAAAQLLFLNTPPHAAVDGAVAQVRRLGRLAGLVNAVARRLARDADSILKDQDAERLNCPDWLWRSWEAVYGEENLRAMVSAMLAEPDLHLSVRSDTAAWADRLHATVLPTGTLRRDGGGRIEDLPGYAEGGWWVQDAAAALPARLLGDLAGRDALDLCAAPGGKTAQLAAAGARVTALDISPGRLARVAENLDRLKLPARLVEADATTWRPDAPADAILLDAPCTSTGTIRRHPDIWHLKRPEDVAQMAALQDRLLDAACEMLAPGGMLVFCTCSLQPEEGPERIAALLARDPTMRRSAIPDDFFSGLPAIIDSAGDLRTLPHHHGGMDGFFASRLVRDVG